MTQWGNADPSPVNTPKSGDEKLMVRWKEIKPLRTGHGDVLLVPVTGCMWVLPGRRPGPPPSTRGGAARGARPQREGELSIHQAKRHGHFPHEGWRNKRDAAALLLRTGIPTPIFSTLVLFDEFRRWVVNIPTKRLCFSSFWPSRGRLSHIWGGGLDLVRHGHHDSNNSTSVSFYFSLLGACKAR